MKHDIDDAQLVADVTRVAYDAKKTITAVGGTVALIVGEVVASGILHGSAQTIAQSILAVLGVLGIGGGVYRVENKPKG